MIDHHFTTSDTNGWHNEPTVEEIEADRLAQAESVRALRRTVLGDKLIKVYDPGKH